MSDESLVAATHVPQFRGEFPLDWDFGWDFSLEYMDIFGTLSILLVRYIRMIIVIIRAETKTVVTVPEEYESEIRRHSG